jgi:hypothetical protein
MIKLTIAMSCMAIVLFSCSNLSDHSSDVPKVDSMLVKLDSSIAMMKNLLLEPLDSYQDTVLAKTAYIQENFRGTMNDVQAEAISKYRYTVSSFPQASEHLMDALSQCLTSKNQINELKNVIVNKATKDALGNEITDMYISEALKQETIDCEASLQSAKVYSELYLRAIKNYNDTKTFVDSLVQQIPPRKQ